MPNDSRKERVTKTWDAAWDRGEVDAFDTLLSPGYRRRSSSADEGLSLAEFKRRSWPLAPRSQTS